MSLVVSADDDDGPTWTEAASLLQYLIQRFDVLTEGTAERAPWGEFRPKALKVLDLLADLASEEELSAA